MLPIYPTIPIIPLEFISMRQLILLEISNYIKRIPQPDEPVHQFIRMSRVFAEAENAGRRYAKL